MAVDVGSAVGHLDLDISGFLAGWRQAQQEAESSSKNMATRVGNSLTGVGKTMQTAGMTLTKSVTTPIVTAGAAVIKLSADFESSLSKVRAISGASGEDMGRLSAKAQEMGATTKFSASEAADAMTYMAMAGWETEAMLEGIDGIMNLAAASGEDLATTSDIVTDALTAFGMSASDSSHFADVLAQASASANTNVSMLGESFKYVAPVAGALGYTAEDTAIALSLMANAGIKGSQGGTALRSSLSRLVKPTGDAADMMESYGLSLTNTDGSMKSLGDVMGMLRTKLGGLTEAEQAQVAATLFGQEAMSGMLAIINASEDDYAKLTESIYGADGAAKQMADTMMDNLSGQLTILKSSLEGLALQLGEVILPYVKTFVSRVQQLVQWFSNLSKEQKEQVVKWAAIAAAIGPVLLVVGKVVSGVGTMVTTFGKLSAVFSKVSQGSHLLSGAFKVVGGAGGAVVAAIAVLIAAFATLWQTNEEFRNAMIGIWESLKSTVGEFIGQISSRLGGLKEAFTNIINFLTPLWMGFCDLLAPVFTAAFQYIVDALGAVFDVIVGILDVFIGIFTGNWSQAWDGIKGIFTGIWEAMQASLNGIISAITGIVDVFLGWFGTSWSALWNSAKSTFSNIWNGIKSTASSVFNSIKSTTSSIWNGIKSTLSSILDGIKSKVTSVVDGIKSTFSSGFNAAKSTVTSIFSSIASTVQSKIDTAKNAVSNAIDRIKSAFNFSWSLPHLALPHLSISGSFSINPPSVPHFSISWYKKAMEGGMILNAATIFGMDRNGRLLGGGEAGPEAVVGVGSLKQMIMDAVQEAFRAFAEYVSERLSEVLSFSRDVNCTVVLDKDSWSDGGKSFIDYDRLEQAMMAVAAGMPVPQVVVEMQDGDVYMDNERVGRKLAPVVSRVIAQKK